MAVNRLRTVIPFVLVYLLVACSGSSKNTGIQQGSDTDEPGAIITTEVPAAVSGLVLIQENNGKRTFDAFFTDTPRTISSGAQLWGEGDQICVGTKNVADADSTQALSPVIGATVYAGASVDIDARDGRYLTLEPQTLGDTVVYSSDTRWTDTELPQDAVLSVSESDWFSEEIAITLYPLQPIERLEPENGVLLREASGVRWDSANTENDKIQLDITMPFENPESTNVTTVSERRVHCFLPDSGSFNIPDSVRESMGNPDVLHVSLSRRRTSEISYAGSTLAVVQISNDQ